MFSKGSVNEKNFSPKKCVIVKMCYRVFHRTIKGTSFPNCQTTKHKIKPQSSECRATDNVDSEVKRAESKVVSVGVRSAGRADES